MLLVCCLGGLLGLECFISFSSSVFFPPSCCEGLGALGAGCGWILLCCGLGNWIVSVVCWSLWDSWPSQRGGNAVQRRPSSTACRPKHYITTPYERTHTHIYAPRVDQHCVILLVQIAAKSCTHVHPHMHVQAAKTTWKTTDRWDAHTEYMHAYKGKL